MDFKNRKKKNKAKARKSTNGANGANGARSVEVDEELFPVLVKNSLPEKSKPSSISPHSLYEEIQADDLRVMQTPARYVAACWERAMTIEEVCKLTDATIKILKARRDFLDYSTERKAATGGSYLAPVED